MPNTSTQNSLSEQVYSRLLETICSGSLPPGTRLTQEWLADQLKVSRQPVGQALALLKSQGFVCDVGRRGLMIAPLNPEFVRSIYAVRGALDRLAAREAANNRDPRLAKDQGQRLLANGRRAQESGSVSELIAADIKFHGFIYELSGNPIIADTVSLHWSHLRRVMGAYLKNLESAGNTWKEHTEILRLIVAGDAEGAEDLAGAHVDKASRLLQATIASSEPAIDWPFASPVAKAI